MKPLPLCLYASTSFASAFPALWELFRRQAHVWSVARLSDAAVRRTRMPTGEDGYLVDEASIHQAEAVARLLLDEPSCGGDGVVV